MRQCYKDSWVPDLGAPPSVAIATFGGRSPLQRSRRRPQTINPYGIAIKSIEREFTEEAFAEYYPQGITERNYVIGGVLSELLRQWDRTARILIPGTGRGRNTIELWLRGFNDYYGVDLNRLALVSGNLDRHFVQAPIEALPFSKDTFQYAYVSDVFQDFVDRESILFALREVVRSMEKKGQILLTNPTAESYLVETAEFDCDVKRFPKNRPAVIRGNGAEVKGVMKCIAFPSGQPVEIGFVDHVWKEKELEQIFKEAGLAILAKRKPLAKEIPMHKWISEAETPPWVIYLLEVV